MKILRKPLSLFMAMLMCLGVFVGTGTTAFAATEDVGTITFTRVYEYRRRCKPEQVQDVCRRRNGLLH